MSKLNVNVEHVPSYQDYTITYTQLAALLDRTYPGIQIHLWDNAYWYIYHEDWGKVFKDVLSNFPKYTAERFDCENYAMLCSARVSEKYKLNTCGICIGDSPMGWHGYNVFLSAGMTLDILEPQTGMVYHSDEDSGYIPKLVIFGG